MTIFVQCGFGSFGWSVAGRRPLVPALVLTRRGRRSCGSHPVTNGVTRVSSSAPLTIVRRRVTGMHRVRGKIYAYILTETACVIYSVEVSTYDPQARFGRDHGRYRDRGLPSSLIEDCLVSWLWRIKSTPHGGSMIVTAETRRICEMGSSHSDHLRLAQVRTGEVFEDRFSKKVLTKCNDLKLSKKKRCGSHN